MRTNTLAPSRRPGLPTVIQPLHHNYDHARLAWNRHADQRPAGVVAATTAEDVRQAVAFAAANGLRVAPQGTGHLAAALPALDDALLLKTALHDEVEVDPVAMTARIKAGALWEDVADAVAAHGLAVMHGSSPDVGVMGYVLGGGLSFYARKHGLTASHVKAIEVVTADGELRRVDAHDDPDLFWALRGGGGNFGVVTAIELGLLPYSELFAGATFWPVAHAAAVVDAWVEWTRTAPVDVTTSLRILRLPPVPEVPEPLRAVPVVAVDGVALDDAEGERLAALLGDVAPPIIHDWGRMPSQAIIRLHGDPEQPTPGIGDTALLRELDAEAIAAFVAANGEDSGSPLLVAELRQLGGALAAPAPGGGATCHMPGGFALFAVGVPMAPGAEQAIEAHLDHLLEAMRPWALETRYLNFAERGGPAARSFDDQTNARLAAIRRRVDPDGLFLASHAIG